MAGSTMVKDASTCAAPCALKPKLAKNAAELSSPKKGLLAADESTGTIGKRFHQIGVENTETNRHAYREVLLSAAPEYSEHISGVILFDETMRQKTADGKPVIDFLKAAGVKIGVKVDKGLVTYAANETFTVGLDGLEQRLKEYADLGAEFTKWRAALPICPATHRVCETTLHYNAVTLAQYALLSQRCGLVPVVEPETLCDGAHTLLDARAVSERVLSVVFAELIRAGVFLEGMVLKPSMVIPGTTCSKKATTDEIAKATLVALQRTVPAAVPGIFFLSGGQTEEEATQNLSAIAALPGKKPWSVSFSFGRALQQSAIKAWAGKKENAGLCKAKLVEKAKANGTALRNKCPFTEAPLVAEIIKKAGTFCPATSSGDVPTCVF